MKQRIRLFALVLFAACACSLAAAATLTTQERAKIHPDFQVLLAKTYPDLQGVGGSVARLAKAPGATESYQAIVYTSDASAVRATGAAVNSVYPGFVTAQVTPAQILALAQTDAVRYIDEGSMNYPANDVSVPETGASLVQGGFLNSTQYRGAGAIVLIYDTGIDWKHRDFRSPTDSTKSRILSIWDQTLSPVGAEVHPSGFGYGVEYTQAQINAELGSSPPGFVREKDINGHGTHVAGTAAGNDAPLFNKFSGMAPDADIIVVKGGDGSFQESSMIDGLTYAQNRATALGKPIVVNWSIGGQVGPHDGSRAYETAINSFVSTPGRVVAVAAGNDGGSLIHIGGNAGPTTTVTFTVPSYTPSAGTGSNQFLFDMWLNSNTGVSVSATAPDGYTASASYNLAGTSGNGNSAADGMFTVYDIPSFTSNGAWNVQFWVRDDGVNFPKAGTWTLTVTNPGSAVRWDGWLALRTLGTGVVTLNGGDGAETVSMPGTSSGAITAAAYVTKWSWPVYANLQYVYNGSDRTGNIATFSAVGPTRDGRTKPDIAAPGQGITSALSTVSDTTGLASIIYPGQKHFVDQGTSMATPHVTGASALILGGFPTASAATIKNLFESGAIHDAFTGTVPNNTWGYGKLDVLEAVAKQISSSAVVTRNLYSYDGTAANALLTLTGTTKYAVRISPTVTGQLTGITLNVTTPNNNPIQGVGNLVIEAYTNSSGLPGTKIGSSVIYPLTRLSAGTPNYIQMLGAGVSVTSGVDFHIVVSISNPSETLLFRTEGASGTHSSTFNGSSWSAVTTQNHRIRAIVTTAAGLTSVGPATQGVPVAFDLEQNYPNPFNPTTRIAYTVGERGLVTLEVFDILGRNVTTLVNETQAAGSYQITWNGRNGANMPVTSGVYFYRLKSGGLSKTNRMVLLK
ncbi:MAG TPA: S8 family serine peptidase [Bacteroidota bacterium]|nr:S8 family serine peptidase [Bacteroidota bacterium]